MLNINEINFPITFDLKNESKSITYTDPSTGSYADGDRTELKVSFFVNAHNKHNPKNDKNKRYYYEMAEKKENNPGRYFFAKFGEMHINGAIFTASIGAKDYDYICDVELMPVGAILVGVQRECGEWDELKFKPRRIEVHDDTITLLSGYTGGYKTGNNYSGEINIKRGTKVKIKNSTNC